MNDKTALIAAITNILPLASWSVLEFIYYYLIK